MTFGGFVFLLIVGFVFMFIGYNIGYDRGMTNKKRFPWSRLPGTFVAVAFLLIAPASVQAFTIQWDNPTQYADNTAIPGGKIIYIDGWVDGTRFLTKIVGTSATIPAPGSGVAHLYELTATVDNVSSARAGINWTSPLAAPGNPFNLRISP